jgi:hypothetical protein
MAELSIHSGDMHVTGNLSCVTFSSPSNSISNAAVSSTANIDTSKLIHRHALRFHKDGTVATENALLHVCRAAGTIAAFEAVIETPPGGDRTVTLDLQKGNASTAFATVLSSTVTINSGTAARTVVVGTISSATLADNDILKLVVTVAGSSGTQPAGLCVVVTVNENPN